MINAIQSLIFWCAGLFFVFSLTACGGSGSSSEFSENDSTSSSSSSNSSSSTSSSSSSGSGDSTSGDYIIPDTHEASSDYEWQTSDETLIYLEGDEITVVGVGASVSEGNVTVTRGGNFRIIGVLDNGSVIVDSDDENVVRLILAGVDISNSSSAPVNIVNAEKTVIILDENSSNSLTDSSDYVFPSSDEDEPNATLFSKDDLSIAGSGSLTISANYNDAITSKDGLVINSGTLTINAVDDGIRGKDYLVVNGGHFEMMTGGDGLKSDNEDEGAGYIAIDDGTFVINAGADGVQANKNVQISGGDFTITTAGGHEQVLASDETAKAIKAGTNVFIDGGVFALNAADDAVHANLGIIIDSGDFTIATGDDGIHADAELTLGDGSILVTASYEGLESAVINLNGGRVNVSSSDDGINVAGGVDGSGAPGGHYAANSGYLLAINNGYIVVNADGDGLDANGNITMSGGTVLVNGPTASMNGALDYDGTFNLSGGFLLAVGSSRMAQGPGNDSSQIWLGLNYGTTLSAGELLHLESGTGEVLFTFAPAKATQSLVFSSPNLSEGMQYDLYAGGASSGEENDGLYSGGVYSGGSLLYSFSP